MFKKNSGGNGDGTHHPMRPSPEDPAHPLPPSGELPVRPANAPPSFSWMIATEHNDARQLHHVHSEIDSTSVSVTPIDIQSFPELQHYQYKRQAKSKLIKNLDALYVSFVADDISDSVMSGEHLMTAMINLGNQQQTLPQSLYYDQIGGQIYDHAFIPAENANSEEPIKLYATIATEEGLQLFRYVGARVDNANIFDANHENQPPLFMLESRDTLTNQEFSTARLGDEGQTIFSWDAPLALTLYSPQATRINIADAQCQNPLPIVEKTVGTQGDAVLFFCLNQDQQDQSCSLNLDLVRNSQQKHLVVDAEVPCQVFTSKRPNMIVDSKDVVHIVYQKDKDNNAKSLMFASIGPKDNTASVNELKKSADYFTYLQLVNGMEGSIYLSHVSQARLQVEEILQSDDRDTTMRTLGTYITFGEDIAGTPFDITDFQLRGLE